MIQFKNLEIGYKSKRSNVSLFHGINLNLDLGSLVGLIGDNGIGKSTLLKTIIGITKPLNGDVLIGGKNSMQFSSLELSKIVSIVTTDKIGGFNLTVWDIVASGRMPYINMFGELKDEDKLIIEDSLNELSIFSLKDKLIDELSDGQRQKVMISKSLAQQTPIIILDEPTAFLDYNSKHQLFSILKKLSQEQNKLIIVSSHDLDLMKLYITKSITLTANNTLVVK